MKIFLVSDSFVSVRENDIKKDVIIDKSNGFLRNLKREIKRYENFVFVCNDPDDFKENDTSAQFVARALEKQIRKFRHVFVLDNRKKSNAKEIIMNADVIYLQGGKIPKQNKFLFELQLDKILPQTNAVVIGKSAGAMNLCSVVYNYPEEDDEVDNERWYNGLGFCDKIIIPHFNLSNGNDYCLGNFDLIKDFYSPDSMGKELIAIKNGAYIFIKNNQTVLYGEAYKISDGIITRICENENCTML